MKPKVLRVWLSEDYIQVKVSPWEGSAFHFVEVTRDRRFSSREWQPSEVNWPSFGGQEADRAEAFGNAIKFAAQIARELDKGIIPEEGCLAL